MWVYLTFPVSVYAKGLSLLIIFIRPVIGKGTVLWLSEPHRSTGHRPKHQKPKWFLHVNVETG